MIIRTPADLGAAIRAGRNALGMDQAHLAARVGVQRQWVIKIESGKSTAEVGLVLRALSVLALKVEVGESINGPSLGPPAGISYDIDAALERTRPNATLGWIGHGTPQSTSPRQRDAEAVVGRGTPKKRKP
jgi:HTH-type transcriptional regulator / antitoxin HipB